MTVAESLTDSNEEELTGGLAYLGEIANNTPSAANIRRYAEIVTERAILRKLVATADEISADAMNPAGRGVMELLEKASSMVMGLAGARHAGREPQSIDELLPGVLETLERRTEKRGQIAGLPTGFGDLDRATCGLHPGELIVIAGRPSMGKSTLAANIAENVAINGGTAFFVSLEMSAHQLAERAVARFGGLDTQALRSGDLDDDGYSRISASLARLHQKRLVIADDPSLSRAAYRVTSSADMPAVISFWRRWVWVCSALWMAFSSCGMDSIRANRRRVAVPTICALRAASSCLACSDRWA